jgi:hypothetical protein
MDGAQENLQEYDPTVSDPVRVWVFCRDCRCRLQVRMVPRPALPFACLCGKRGALADFDVLDQEARAKEVAETFEVAYAATKEALSPFMDLQKTRMYNSGEFAALLESEEAAPLEAKKEERFPPQPFESEADFQGQLDTLMKALDGAGGDLLARHEALTDVAEFTFARRQLRSAARAFCVRACKGDIDQIRALIAAVSQSNPGARLRFPSFRMLITIYEEAGDLKTALRVAKRAQRVGMPGFDAVIDRLKAFA